MDIRKYNQKMGRPKYAKGGYIKKKGDKLYFDSGGTVNADVIPQNQTATPVGGGNLTNTNTQGIGGLSSSLGLNAASSNIQPGTNTNQLNNAYTGANNAINSQIGVTNALVPGAQTGVNAQNQVLQQELEQANGQGPNVAQNELAQATNANVANQAALAAGQRGGAGNIGLQTRQAAQQGNAAEQAAAGQAATLKAEQQIAGMQQAAGIAGTEVGQAEGATQNLSSAQQNEQNLLQNANTATNNTAAGMQANINNVNAQNNQGLLGAVSSGVGAVAGLVGGLFEKGGEVGKAGEMPSKPVDPHAKHKLEFVHKMTKMGLDHFADGGQITGNPLITGQGSQQMAPGAPGGGSNYTNPASSPGMAISSGPSGSPADLGKSFSSGFNSTNKAPVDPFYGAQSIQGQDGTEFGGSSIGDSGASGLSGVGESNPMSGDSSDFSLTASKGGEIWKLHPSQHAQYAADHFKRYFSKGGESSEVEAMVSPGEVYLDPEAVERVKHGADPIKEGMRVPGKAKVRGDSLKNDTIPAKLREGGVVIDREHVGHPDKARLFVLKSLKATGKHMKRPRGA